MEFYEWLEIGQNNKWVSDMVCLTHEGIPMTDEEIEQCQEGDDFCYFAIRVWED